MKSDHNNNPILYLLPFLTLAISFFTAYHLSISAILSHGITWHILIPPMALLLAWKQLVLWVPPRTGFSSYFLGSLIVLASFFITFTGNVTSTQALTELGIIAGLWGCVLFIGGFSLFTTLIWPLLYLLFISSLAEGAFDIFTVFFRNASAKLSFVIARMLGFSIMNTGTYIRLPTMILNVANECSGINHFISLAAISLPLAILSQRKIWAATIIILSSFPIALFSNSLRVFFLIIYNYKRVEFSHGPKNLLVNGFGFFFGLLMLYGLATLLSRFVPGTLPVDHKDKWESLKNYAYKLNQKSIYTLSALLLIGITTLSIWKVKSAEQPKLFLQPFPSLTIQSKSASSFPGIDTLPITDNHLILEFFNNSPDQCFLLLGWYAKQEQNREMNGYNWNRLFSRTGAYTYTTNTGKTIKFDICKPHHDADRFHYLITYRTGNQYTTDPLKMRLYLLQDALLHRSTSGTICILAVSNDRARDISFITGLLDTLFPVIDSGLR